jgi:hypothetical protein
MHRDCPEKENASSTPVLQLPARGKERQHIPPTTSAKACQGRAAEEEAARKIHKHNWKGVLIHLHKTADVLRGSAPKEG